MNIKNLPLIVVTAVSIIIAACGGASAGPYMAIIGSLPVQLANNTLADATQVMSDLNYIVTQVNANAAGLAGTNNFTGANTINGDVIVTATASQTLTNKTVTDIVITNSGTAGKLSWYEESTFTPTIAFGGGSTGVTYATQSGKFTRIGQMCFVNVRVKLTSKGSSTGQISVLGIPTAGVGITSLSIGYASGFTGLTGALVSYISGTAITVGQTYSQGSNLLVDNTFATNTLDVVISGSYACT
jgi:hypothetical protein